MEIRFNRRTLKIVLLTVLITFLVTVCLIVAGAWAGFNIFVDQTIQNIAGVVETQCKTDPLIYRGEVKFPKSSPKGFVYEKELATILWDIGGVVGSSNCHDSIPMPPPFNRLQRLSGKDGNNGNKDTMYGYVFWSEGTGNDDLACFIFAGTYHRHQWRDNLNLNLTFAPELRGSVPDTQIHSGFYGNYQAVRESIWDWWSAHSRVIKKLIISGRSLGGALSTVCAYDFAMLNGVEILHYSFASPRVGNVTFADIFDERVPNSIRIYNTEDVVTNLPPAIYRSNVYKHVGRPELSKIFTKNMGSLVDNHIEAYRDLPL